MFCKDEGPEDEEGNGLVIGIWQWLITEADVMFLRLDWKLARIPCGLNGHWALSWKGEETQRGPHRMATGFVNSPACTRHCSTNNHSWLNCDRKQNWATWQPSTLAGLRSSNASQSQPCMETDPEYCLLPIYPRPCSESQETITPEKHALQTEMVREGPILLSVSSPWPYQPPAHSRCFKRRTNWVWWN